MRKAITRKKNPRRGETLDIRVITLKGIYQGIGAVYNIGLNSLIAKTNTDERVRFTKQISTVVSSHIEILFNEKTVDETVEEKCKHYAAELFVLVFFILPKYEDVKELMSEPHSSPVSTNRNISDMNSEEAHLIDEVKFEEESLAVEDQQKNKLAGIYYSIFNLCSEFIKLFSEIKKHSSFYEEINLDKIKENLRKLVENTNFREHLLNLTKDSKQVPSPSHDTSDPERQNKIITNERIAKSKIILNNIKEALAILYPKHSTQYHLPENIFKNVPLKNRSFDVNGTLLEAFTEVIKGSSLFLSNAMPIRLISVLNHQLHEQVNIHISEDYTVVQFYEGTQEEIIKEKVARALESSDSKRCKKIRRLIDAMINDFYTMTNKYRHMLHPALLKSSSRHILETQIKTLEQQSKDLRAVEVSDFLNRTVITLSAIFGAICVSQDINLGSLMPDLKDESGDKQEIIRKQQKKSRLKLNAFLEKLMRGSFKQTHLVEVTAFFIKLFLKLQSINKIILLIENSMSCLTSSRVETSSSESMTEPAIEQNKSTSLIDSRQREVELTEIYCPIFQLCAQFMMIESKEDGSSDLANMNRSTRIDRMKSSLRELIEDAIFTQHLQVSFSQGQRKQAQVREGYLKLVIAELYPEKYSKVGMNGLKLSSVFEELSPVGQRPSGYNRNQTLLLVLSEMLDGVNEFFYEKISITLLSVLNYFLHNNISLRYESVIKHYEVALKIFESKKDSLSSKELKCTIDAMVSDFDNMMSDQNQGLLHPTIEMEREKLVEVINKFRAISNSLGQKMEEKNSGSHLLSEARSVTLFDGANESPEDLEHTSSMSSPSCQVK